MSAFTHWSGVVCWPSALQVSSEPRIIAMTARAEALRAAVHDLAFLASVLEQPRHLLFEGGVVALGHHAELRILEAELKEGEQVGQLLWFLGHLAHAVADFGDRVQRRCAVEAAVAEVLGHAADALLGDGQQQFLLGLESQQQRGRRETDLARDVFETHVSRPRSGQQAGRGIEDGGIGGGLGPR